MTQAQTSKRIAAWLRDEILRGHYAAGDRLPAERDLALELRVGRSSVREAFKTLEQLGLVEIRHGGGVTVQPLEMASLDVLPHLLLLNDAVDVKLLAQLLEVQEELMSAAARLAVERGSDEQVERGRELLAALVDPGAGDADYFAGLGDLLGLMTAASQNLVMRMVRRGIGTLLPRAAERRAQLRPPLAVLEPLIKDLDRALVARDVDAAGRAVRRLFRANQQYILAGLGPAPGDAS